MALRRAILLPDVGPSSPRPLWPPSSGLTVPFSPPGGDLGGTMGLEIHHGFLGWGAKAQSSIAQRGSR